MSHLNDESKAGGFRASLQAEFNQYLLKESNKYNLEDCLKVDLHCHDRNSDVPDELWGRILGLPETWLKTKKLVKSLKKNGCDVITVTNHNNARSCWELIEDGQDVLVAAEFTCFFPEYDLFVHVLTFGFSRPQEKILFQKRENIYDFLRYAHQHNIPVILPHPLYFYTSSEHINFELFEKLAVLFQRFEVLNGQRDLWQSVLTLNWITSLTPEKVKFFAKKHQLNPEEFGVDPNKPKVLTGGSDCHMGMFAGHCGSYLWVPNLSEKLKQKSASELALDAIREGHVAPFGLVMENQKLNIALLDYAAQIATKMEDPGLFRMLMHRGELKDKIACLAIGNIMLEMRNSKNTQKFFGFVHDALAGKKPSKLFKWKVPKEYKFFISYLENIADAKEGPSANYVDVVNKTKNELFTHLNQLIIKRVKGLNLTPDDKNLNNLSTEYITRKFEIPCQISNLLSGNVKSKNMSGFDIKKVVSSLSFPLIISAVLAGTTLASTRVLYKNREFLDKFANYLGKHSHSKRALYLTDTLFDKNGVSNSLSGKLKEIQKADLPIDFLICHDEAESQPHLHVIKPLVSFNIPGYTQQEIRIPDLLQIANVFYQGGYDRIVCSTEGPMALVSLFIKYMFNVPCYFFMHTDWMDFIQRTTNLNHHERDRIRRALRMLYHQYDGVFVLNSEHRQWLTEHEMEIPEENVFITAHHAQKRDDSIEPIKKSDIFSDASQETPVLFIACRISKEKGIFDLPEIIAKARQSMPDLRIVIAGTGPDEDELKQALPDAHFLGWVDKKTIHRYYSGLDLFIFPSRFDTFGNVILEAFTYGMSVLAYDCKGPRDIIEHKKSGYLVNTIDEMSQTIIDYFKAPESRHTMSQQAMTRASEYQAEPIMHQFLTDMGLPVSDEYKQQRSVA